MLRRVFIAVFSLGPLRMTVDPRCASGVSRCIQCEGLRTFGFGRVVRSKNEDREGARKKAFEHWEKKGSGRLHHILHQIVNHANKQDLGSTWELIDGMLACPFLGVQVPL